ncbi:MAG TPA: CotH kinase family protein [Kiritimatiellia bacterium]|jgi:hypothetical protein|nr:MAG: CotH protein [Verrucomicrobia bacterium ADurb.Bin018]HOE00631.1 CotH kinase family protein [Kiritimatiellia bacterium]HOE36004.1 CotH kinase family protein [Kiritimatiellia bacterium]HOR73320.1 CotH kinase family protein [Kiritimatiellia bacterium]HOU58225.1 CotH kinase family protein [Kiritimatiellia bacterium]
MKKTLRSFWRWILLLAMAAGAVTLWRSDRWLFEWPAEKSQHYFEGVGHRLAKHHGLAFLMTFDEAHPVEWIARGTVLYPGTTRVPGRLGFARQFDGKARTMLETTAIWPALGSNYTLSLWVKVEPACHDQEIWYTFIQGRYTGFKLQNGQMMFFVPGSAESPAAHYPFTAYGKFVHLAGVVDAAQGTAQLYENGTLKATVPFADVSHPTQNIEFGKTRMYAVTAPFCGAIDEAAAWTRSLSSREIHRLAHAHRSLPRALEPFAWFRWRMYAMWQAALPATLNLLTRFNPLLHEGRLATLPTIELRFSSKDARHFRNTHEASLASGRRTDEGAKWRRIYALHASQTAEAHLQLDGSTASYPIAKRPGYILELPPESPIFGARTLRLVPPENLADRLPTLAQAVLATTPTNHAAGPKLCRLLIDGQSKGAYVAIPFAQRGVGPGERTWVADGARNPNDWTALFRGAKHQPDVPTLTAEQLSTGLREARILLAHDLFNPWSPREMAWRFRPWQEADDMPEILPLTSFTILGNNPAPFYIVEDLDLAAVRWAGKKLTWHSSRPNIVDNQGHVTRPAGDVPVDVKLTATLGTGKTRQKQTLAFRVIPQTPRLAAIHLSVAEALSATHRVEFSARFDPAGGGEPQWLQGGQASGGGIKHRGNTSYWRGRRKPFSLRFDTSQSILGAGNSPYLLFLNGYADATKLKNKLAYDFFRACATPDQPRFAPELEWCEVFFNGAYFGIYEMCTRVDENMTGLAPVVPDNPGGAIFKIRPSPHLFQQPEPEAADQIFPSPSRADRRADLTGLLTFTSQSSPDDFKHNIAAHVDLANAIDFLLLLNLAQNVDGRTTNFYLARGDEPAARFFFIPWDYDHTFEKTGRWLSNYLFDRLWQEMPDFSAQTGQRWRELRHGIWSDAALQEWIASMSAHLADYMAWDDAVMEREDLPKYSVRIEQFRQAVLESAHALDERLAIIAPPQAPPAE